MKPKKYLLATFSVLLIAALLAACGSPALAPTAQPTTTPIPPTRTPIPPTATPTQVQPTVVAVATATERALQTTPAAPGSDQPAAGVLSGFVENDGVRIHYEVEGDGPPLILVHWLTGSLEDWRVFGYVDALKENHRLILIDARGHGQSDKPHDTAAYALEIQAADVVAVLDELGVDQSHYFGYSLGGELGWALGQYAPDRLSSLIIGGASPEDFDPSVEIARDRRLSAEGYGGMAADVLSGYGFSRPRLYAIYAATDFEAIIADLQAISAPNFAADLPGMTLPILLLAGTRDEDYRAMEAATSKLPNATFAPLPDNDHMTAYLRTDLLLEHLTKFLASVETAGLDDATVAKIETLVEEIMTKGKVPGAAVGIVKDGELVYASGFGVSKLGSDEPVTPDSIFQMSSVAKTPTAMAIMQLVTDGKIDLDAPVTKYLPYFTLTDPDVGEVTIRRLLSHTAGMPDPIDWLAEYQDKKLRNDKAALDAYVRSLSDQSLTFRPGKDWSYSNTGFDILGDVVAQVSGQAFEDYLQANVLTPLGMESSSYLLSNLDPARLVAPHMPDEDGNAKTIDFYPYTRAHAPSGAFYSSVSDMARFAIANMNQGTLDGARVLPASAYDKMWAPQAASPWAEMFGPEVSNYALGWWVGDFNGHRIIGNYGAEFGFQSHFGMFPDDGMAVIALVNLFDPEAGAFYALDIGRAVAAVLLGVETKPTPQP